MIILRNIKLGLTSHRILLVYKADFILKCFFFFFFFIVDNVEFTYQPRFYNNVFTNFEKLIDVNFFSNMYFLIFIIQINSHVLQGLQGRSRGSYFWFWLNLIFACLENYYLVNFNYKLVLQNKIGGEKPSKMFYVSIARFPVFLWCIVKEISLSRKSWKSLSESVLLRIWNIHAKGQYRNWNSMKTLIIILLLSTFMNGSRRARAISFEMLFYKDYWHCHQNLIICQLLFQEVLLFDSMEEPVTAVSITATKLLNH